ncbi:hypothetical protein LOD99_4627 [Oopsacas minuta]|uniref:Uncharacterized protein n=1 Tax=Oopsacas minuta TaxID=111878 RepID=A0AAV7JSX0_9METZ|nr:hypothetical protein LOD99_4627 [Oopsacas minuta]
MEVREAERKKNINEFLSCLHMTSSNFLDDFTPSRDTRPEKQLYKDVLVDNSKSVLLQFGQAHPFLIEVEKEKQRIKQREKEIEREAQLLIVRKKRERSQIEDQNVKKKKPNEC